VSWCLPPSVSQPTLQPRSTPADRGRSRSARTWLIGRDVVLKRRAGIRGDCPFHDDKFAVDDGVTVPSSSTDCFSVAPLATPFKFLMETPASASARWCLACPANTSCRSKLVDGAPAGAPAPAKLSHREALLRAHRPGRRWFRSQLRSPAEPPALATSKTSAASAKAPSRASRIGYADRSLDACSAISPRWKASRPEAARSAAWLSHAKAAKASTTLPASGDSVRSTTAGPGDRPSAAQLDGGEPKIPQSSETRCSKKGQAPLRPGSRHLRHRKETSGGGGGLLRL